MCYVLLCLCVTPERTVIDGGLGAVAVVSVGFTMCTDGVTVGCIPNTLPLRPSSGPAVEPRSPSETPKLDTPSRRHSTTAFCFCLTNRIARTCSIAVGSSRCIVHTKTVRSVAWAPSGKTFATASFNSNTGIWEQEEDNDDVYGFDLELGESVRRDWGCVSTLEGHETECKCVAYSSTGTLLASCSRDKTVWVWEGG